MADIVANVSLGAVKEKIADGADIIIVLLKIAEADDTLRDYDDLDALLAAAGNTEADFTNYGRKTILNVNITVTVDDVNNRTDIDFADQTWADAGGAADNGLVKAVVCADGATDADRIPLTLQDFVVTTDGNDLVLEVAAAGFYRAT